MNPEEQLARIQLVKVNSSFNEANTAKFLRGQEEHGGDFFEKPTVENIREEAIDLVNYVHVLRLHKNQILLDVDELLKMCDQPPSPSLKLNMQLLRARIENL